jgi:N-acetylglucosaminyldiphosphoundecaprenol N-acetyl-beta-D-mannosaminyltransferase
MAALQSADLNLPDGMGVVWATRIMGAREKELPGRLYGPTVMLEVIGWGIDREITHSFVGGSPSTLVALMSRLSDTFRGVRIQGAYSPPVRDVAPHTVAEDLAALGTSSDVLWVGLGTPKQQLWAHYAKALRPSRIVATVGAAFDFHAGTKRQAPDWIQRAGLEWSFRLLSEPRRLWRRYLIGNARFVAAVAKDRITANASR